MKNKIFLVALVVSGNVMCSEEYMKVPQPVRGRIADYNSREDMQYRRQVRGEIAAIRSAEEAAKLSEILASKEIATQAEKQEVTIKACESNKQNRVNKTRLEWIIDWLITGRKEGRVISQVVPYAKIVTIETRATLEELDLSSIIDCTDIATTPVTGDRLYRKSYVARLDDLYVNNPEAFHRASAFTGLSFITPSEISSQVVLHENLTDEQKEKFLNIIHALHSGIIENRNHDLVMTYTNPTACPKK